MIRVLVVEDSPVAQEFLTYILASDPDIRVVGVAKNGAEAQAAVEELRPSVITMDIHMPIMDGFEATRRIMESVPTPIVVVSGSTGTQELASTFRAMEAGALAVVLRPAGMSHDSFKSESEQLVTTVKLMSEIKVVRRLSRDLRQPGPALQTLRQSLETGTEIQLVAIGASTGGPPIILKILSGLSPDFPVPILLVQHISADFTTGFVEWLAAASGMPVHVAQDGETPLPGHVYVAPDDHHLCVGPRAELQTTKGEPHLGLRPSVGVLFRSVAERYGRRAIGVILTGMGRDGAEELKLMADTGALTVAQNEESCVVFGMPAEAIKLGAARYVFPPQGISDLLKMATRCLLAEGGMKY